MPPMPSFPQPGPFVPFVSEQPPGHPSVHDNYYQSTMLNGAETVMPLEKVFIFLNLPGCRAQVKLEENVKVHKLRVERLWFTVPSTAVLAPFPADNTLYLRFQSVSGSSNIRCARTIQSANGPTAATTVENIYAALPSFAAPPSASTLYWGIEDPGTAGAHLMRDVVFQFPLEVNTLAVEQELTVVQENKSDIVHSFDGQSKGFNEFRVRLIDHNGDTWQAIDPVITLPPYPPGTPPVRIFIEMHAWVEKRS